MLIAVGLEADTAVFCSVNHHIQGVEFATRSIS